MSLKAQNPDGLSTHSVNLQKLKAGPSAFATALGNGASLEEVQALADRLSHRGVLATSSYALTAMKTFTHYLGSQPLNSAKHLTVLEPYRRVPEERYDLSFQITCIQLGLLFEAPKFIWGLVHEVNREAYFTILSIAQFRRACHVGGHLDWFLLNWASALDARRNWLGERKLASLQRGLRAVGTLRDLFAHFIRDHPAYAVRNVSGEFYYLACFSVLD